MTRILQPKKHEPIRFLETSHGPRYRVVVDVAPKGQPRRQITRTFDTLPRARDFVTKTRAGIGAGTYTPSSSESVSELCQRWLASRVDIRPVTVEGYQNNLAPIVRRLGARKVQSLTRHDITALVSWLASEGGKRGQALSPRSVRAALVAFGQVLDMAVTEGVVATNVSRGVRRPRVVSKKGADVEHWQPAQLQIFRALADRDPLAAAWRLTLAGLTRADVLGLRWSDVDLDAGTVTIRQGRVALDQSDHIDEPKSQQRRRSVPIETIHPGTAAMLRVLKAAQAEDRLALGPSYINSGLVVVDIDGRPVRPEWYSDRFRHLCRDAGVPVIRLHSVRHSLAFWLHRLGITPADAAALLGHTVEVHMSTYLPESGATGISRASEALGKASVAEA